MMSHFTIHGVAGGAMLLLLAGRVAESQDPHSASQTSVVQRIAGDSASRVRGNMRELKCRGKAGIDLRVHSDPAPGRPDFVTMVLRYDRVKATRSLSTSGPGLGVVDNGMTFLFIPGACNWGSGYIPEIPPEPGVVYFDIPRDGQTHVPAGQRDTTIEVAAYYPDPPSLTRYLSDSSHYWVFFVDDLSNVSISFGRWPLGGAAPPTAMTPGPAPATAFGGSLRGGAAAATSSVRSGAGAGSSRPGDASISRTLLPDVRIWGVATAPGTKGVRLVFNTDRGPAGLGGRTGIAVQFSKRRPPWDSAGRQWAYPPGWDSPWLADISRPATGGYMAEPMGRLELRQRYYYLITVESHDASLPPRQVVGTFIASVNPFASAPPAPGAEPASASNEGVGESLRGDATDASGALRDQPTGATTAAGTSVRSPAAAGSTGPSTSRTRLPPDVRIWNIEARPGKNGVELSFETDRAWVRGRDRGVRVQFSTRQPRWEGGLLVSPAVASEWREVTSGWFQSEPHWTLESGKRYYYLITVESNDATLRPRQATGSFLPAFAR
ncbi:MAG TPA: hypothetical protein VF037_00220 [Gemmatimonadales bacterium]